MSFLLFILLILFLLIGWPLLRGWLYMNSLRRRVNESFRGRQQHERPRRDYDDDTEDGERKIYTSGDTLPKGLMEDNFFHSPQFFALCQQTPRHRPYMVTLVDDNGSLLAQMMAVVRYRTSWFPPYYYMHCRIMGEAFL